MPKLQTACTTPAADGMIVQSRSDRAREGQDAVLEFLLLNHPLDCPVCDKGGECPLQDLTFRYGPGNTRMTHAQAHAREAGPDLAADQARPRALHPLLPLHPLLGERVGRHAAGDREPRRPLDHHDVRGPRRTTASSPATSPSCARSARSPRRPTASAARPWETQNVPERVRPVRRSAATPTPPSARATWCACCRATTPRVDEGWLCDRGPLRAFQPGRAPSASRSALIRGGRGLEPVAADDGARPHRRPPARDVRAVRRRLGRDPRLRRADQRGGALLGAHPERGAWAAGPIVCGPEGDAGWDQLAPYAATIADLDGADADRGRRSHRPRRTAPPSSSCASARRWSGAPTSPPSAPAAPGWRCCAERRTSRPRPAPPTPRCWTR